MEKEKGNRFFPAEEEKGEGSVKKKKRKKKKKNHLQPAHLGSEGEAMSPEQNGDSGPEAGPRRAQKASVVELGAAAVPSPPEQGGSEHPLTHSRRKRPRKRSPGVQRDSSESAVSPLEDVSQSGPCSGRAQGPVPRASPVLKKKRKLGALPVNGSGPPAMAWPPPQKEGPPVGPADGGACPAALPQGRRLKKKKGEPSSLHTCDPSSQKTAILKKRKKMKEMSSLVGHSGVLESEVKLIRALGSPGAFSPSKKKQLRTENNFVKFDTPFLPKPLFFRKAKSSTAASSPNPAVQLNKMPSSSKKVTFGLNRNMTAEFKKTDKSILVSPTGPSRVAFNPEQRPLHGVLKTPTSSPASAPLGTRKLLTATPKRRPTAMDFF